VLSIPRQSRINTPIPYEPLDHEDHEIDGCHWMSYWNLMCAKISVSICFCSPVAKTFFAIKLSTFSYDVLYRIQSGYMTTPMILFDEDHYHAIFFEYDLAINTISISQENTNERLFDKDRSFWVDYFNKNSIGGISYNINHINIVNKYYGPVISGLKIELR
jgi:hypothetical protein